MNEYFNLNIDEVQEAITSTCNMISLKRIENLLYKDKDLRMNSIYNNYNMIPTRRDYDFESYNCINRSCMADLFLDAIFEDNYEIKEICTDEDEEVYDELYYNFRVIETQRLYSEEEFEELCQSYSILVLKSEAIVSALKIADGNKTILKKILSFAHSIELNIGDLEDYATVNLSDYQVEILFGTYSLYDLESSADDLLALELYCREVVENGKDKNRNN